MPVIPLQLPQEVKYPTMDFSTLGSLGKVYDDARKKEALADLGKGLADGTLDYKQAGAKLASLGDLSTGLSLMKLGEEEKAGRDFMQSIPGLYGSTSPAATPSSARSSVSGDSAGNAIASIESGGRYDATGPVIASGPMAGQRALGKYQVMESNIGPWSKEVLGREVTPQEFIANPQIQDAIFKGKFGQYVQKYGSPEAASRAWFAGEGGMNDLNRKDQLGTTVGQYGSRFANAYAQEGGAPVRVASVGGIPTPDSVPAANPASANPQVAQSVPAATSSDGLQISPRIQTLLQAVANPRLPAAQKDVAKILLQRELDNSKLPDPVKQYLFAKGQGYDGSFVDYQTQIRKAGATNVNVGDNSKKFDDELDKKTADRFGKYIDNADAARRKLVDIDTMREISTRLGSQGAAAGIKEAVGPYAEALGVNLDGLSDIQAYGQIIQRLAPQQRAPGSGSTSDIEFKGFLKSLPGLSQNPAAREVGLNTMEALARDEMARGEIATKVSTKELSRVEAEKALRALPDPMKGFVEWRKANPQLYSQALKSPAAPASSKPQSPQQKPVAAPPQAGAIEDGYRFKGGDPSKQENWEPVR